MNHVHAIMTKAPENLALNHEYSHYPFELSGLETTFTKYLVHLNFAEQAQYK